jgi:hypothetical protein
LAGEKEAVLKSLFFKTFPKNKGVLPKKSTKKKVPKNKIKKFLFKGGQVLVKNRGV